MINNKILIASVINKINKFPQHDSCTKCILFTEMNDKCNSR